MSSNQPEYITGPWSAEEDKKVLELFSIYDRQWHLISMGMKETRSYKQIRERWVNHLDPSLNKEPLSDEEKAAIQQMYNTVGPKWSRIAKALPASGRTPLMIRNFWYSEQRTGATRIQEKMSISAILNSDQPSSDSSPSSVTSRKRRRTSSTPR